MNAIKLLPLAAAALLASGFACSASEEQVDDDDGISSTGQGGQGTGGFDPQTTGAGAGNAINCDAGPDEDRDQDGFTVTQGDCNDCDANVNPHAVEVIAESGDAADENCNGQVDEVRAACDDGLALTDGDAMNGARAIGICDTVAQNGFGVVTANYVRANGGAIAGSTPHVGLLDGFGPNVAPRQGSRLLALSSGHARLPGQPDACGFVGCGSIGSGTAPAGFPQDVPNCTGANDIYDDVALELTLRAPTNATGFSYEFSFYSHEYPEWVCDDFNDQFIALVSPPPQGSIQGNISFDSQTNPVSVNIALFEVCQGCAQGTGAMVGTGFDTWGGGIGDSGATGWLYSTAPIGPGEEFTIRYAIWDTGDEDYDSTVILDNFQWIADGGTVGVGTAPVPK